MTALPRLTGALVARLADQRDRYNALFAQARHVRPTLSAAAFADVLENTLAPVVNAMPAAAVPAVTDALYDLALELLSQDLLGPVSRYPLITRGWKVLLPALVSWVAAHPRRVAGALTNALHQLAVTPSANGEGWIRAMMQMAPACTSVEVVLQVGQVLAWQAGLTHYRAGALQVAAHLPVAVAGPALGIDPAHVPAALAVLPGNPWLTPAQAVQGGGLSNPQLRLVRQAGGFRGFGGPFVSPPLAQVQGDAFLLTDAQATWWLYADAFGATWHRAQPPTAARPGLADTPFACTGKKAQHLPSGARLDLSPWSPIASVVSDGATLVVTSSHSHLVFLFALTETP